MIDFEASPLGVQVWEGSCASCIFPLLLGHQDQHGTIPLLNLASELRVQTLKAFEDESKFVYRIIVGSEYRGRRGGQ